MKIIKLIIIFFIIFSLNCYAVQVKYPNVLVQTIISVYDGDTFKCDISGYPDIVGKNIGIRINGIDTPERRGSPPKIKAMALKVRDYLAKRLKEAKRIELKNIQRGKYFRIVADVYIDGVDIGKELIKLGYAKPYDGGTKNEWTEKDIK